MSETRVDLRRRLASWDSIIVNMNVWKSLPQRHQQVMVEALHKIAEASGKITVATFIENDDTLRKVRTLGIQYGQGFRLDRPRPLQELKPAAVDLSTGRIGG